MLKNACTRGALFAVDALFLTAICLVLAAGMPQTAFAYVDPSVMTYTIQALAGVAVALSTVLGVVYRRVRKRMVHVLGIDENKGKVVEPDVARVDADELEESDKRMGAFWRAAPKPGEAPKLSFLSRFGRALIVSLFACGAVLLLAPIELVVANSHSLTYNLGNVWVPITLFFLAVSVVIALVMAAIPGRAFDIACGVVAAIGVCFWVQALFLNADLPSMNGEPIAWTSLDFLFPTVLSTVIWIAAIAVCVVFAIVSTKSFRTISLGVCSVFVIITLVGAGTFLLDPDSMSKSRDNRQVYVTQDGLYEVAPSNNVIVFVLDMYDTNQFFDVLEQRPHMIDDFTGFTVYPDTVGSLIPTKYALPYLMTASWPEADEPFADYLQDRYHRSSFLQDIHESNFDIGLYTDTMGNYDQWREVSQLTINQHPLIEKDAVDVDWFGTVTIMAKVSLFRDLPWLLKPSFWYYTDDINIAMTPGGIDDPASTPYIINDYRFHDGLSKGGLSVVDRGGEGAYRLIHLNGAHFPYTMRPDTTQSRGSSYEDQAEGCLQIVAEYLNYMKELGVYDDATIIVTSDHGVWRWGHDACVDKTAPILFVKPAQDAAANQQPYKIDETIETGHIDFHATVMKAVSGDTKGYGTSIFDVEPGVRDRYFLFPLHNGRMDTEIVEYKITGDARDFANWSETGVRWDYHQ